MTRQVRKPQPGKVLKATPNKLEEVKLNKQQSVADIKNAEKETIEQNNQSYKQTLDTERNDLKNFKKAKYVELDESAVEMKRLQAEIEKLQKLLDKESEKHFKTTIKTEYEIEKATEDTLKRITDAQKLNEKFNKEAKALKKSEIKQAKKAALVAKVDAIAEVFSEMLAKGVYITDAIAENFTKVVNGIKNVVKNVKTNYQAGHDKDTNRPVPKKLQPK